MLKEIRKTPQRFEKKFSDNVTGLSIYNGNQLKQSESSCSESDRRKLVEEGIKYLIKKIY
jgi:hypothetical protein